MNNFRAEREELRQRDTFAPRPLRIILLAGLSLFLVGVLVFGNFLLFDKLLLYKDVQKSDSWIAVLPISSTARSYFVRFIIGFAPARLFFLHVHG